MRPPARLAAHPGVQGGGDERVSECVGADVLGDPGAAGDPADDPGGTVPVQPLPVHGGEERTFSALADRQLDRPGGTRGKRNRDDLAALAGDDQGAVAALQAKLCCSQCATARSASCHWPVSRPFTRVLCDPVRV